MVLEKEWLLPMEEKFLLEDVQKEERKLVFHLGIRGTIGGSIGTNLTPRVRMCYKEFGLGMFDTPLSNT